VLLAPTAWQADIATDNIFVGRVSSFDRGNFGDPLRDYLAHTSVPMRPISLDAVAMALRKNELHVSDVSGDVYALQAATKVRIQEVAQGTAQVHAVATDPYRDEASWTLALQHAGIVALGARPIASTPTSWTYRVPAPHGLAALVEKLRASKLFAAKASEIRVTREGTWSQLSLDGDDLLLGEAVPGYQIESVEVGVPPLLAKNAILIDTTEKPSAYWYVPLILVALAAFASIFALALIQNIRRR